MADQEPITYYYREIRISELEKAVLKELSWGQPVTYVSNADEAEWLRKRILCLKKREGSDWHFNSDMMGTIESLRMVQLTKCGLELTAEGLRQASSLPYFYLSYTETELLVLRALIKVGRPAIRQDLISIIFTALREQNQIDQISIWELDEALRVLLVTGYILTQAPLYNRSDISLYKYCVNEDKIDEIREILAGQTDTFDALNPEDSIDLSAEFG